MAFGSTSLESRDGGRPLKHPHVLRRALTEPLECRRYLSNAELVGWEMTGQSAFGTQGLAATTVAGGVTNSTGVTRGSGVTTVSTAAGNAWGGNGWSTTTSAAGISGNQFITFGLTVSTGYDATLSSIGFNYRRSGSGPVSGYWEYQLGGGTWNPIGDFTGAFSSNSSSGATGTAISLSSIAPLQSLVPGSAVDFRLTPYAATSTGGTLYFYGPVSGDDLSVSGSVSAATASQPTIGSFAVNPTSVTAGTPVALTASNVTETGGTVSAVNFYRESNGTTGLQTTGNTPDTFLGAGTETGTTWTLANFPTAGMATGTYVYYAVATDGSGNGSAAASAGLVVTAPLTPLILTGPADYLQLDPDGSHLDIWNAATDTGSITQQVLLSQTGTISYTGSAGDDTLTVDFSNGDPLVASGLSFDGGTGGNNSLTVIGTPGDDLFSVGASSVTIASTFGISVITDADTTAVHIDGGAGINTLTQANQPLATLSFDDPTSQDVVNVQAGTFLIPAGSGESVSAVVLDTLHIETGATVVVASASSHALRTVLVLGTLEDAGTLDLKDNDLILHRADYANVLTALEAGRNSTGGYWNGTGITSSIAAADTTLTTTLALIENQDASGTPLFGDGSPMPQFDGQNVSPTDLLIKYTYYGDANLTGNVDGSDYSRLDGGVAGRLTGWLNGDFNSDGVVDGTDYALADNAFNNQGASLTPPPPPAVVPDVFSNWSAIQAAIALVPQTAGQLASVSVINFGTTVYTGPLNVTNTLNRIRADDGPDRADDGIVYTDPQGSGLPVDGTYYEFTVEPAAGTNMNFSSSIASPGPMRILLTSGGDCYFTGDHYSTFVPVYLAGQNSPIIGGFAVSPTSVVTGSAVTLTATGVSETGGTITGVSFYRETNGVAGLQTGADTLVGAGTETGTTWSIANVSTTGFAAGSYTYYAMATDSGGFVSATSVANLTVTGGITTTGAVLAWDVHGQNGFGRQGLAASTVANGVSNSGALTRGSGVTTPGTSAANAWGGANFSTGTSTAGITAGQFISFGLSVGTGYKLSLTAIDLNYRRSTSGPVNGYWQYELNTGAWTTIADAPGAFASGSTSGSAMTELSLSALTSLQNLAAGTAVSFRLVPYAATTAGGTWYLYDLPGNDLVVDGAVTTTT